MTPLSLGNNGVVFFAATGDSGSELSGLQRLQTSWLLVGHP